jgi:branched-chain amino acid transport system substrate-binding protein
MPSGTSIGRSSTTAVSYEHLERHDQKDKNMTSSTIQCIAGGLLAIGLLAGCGEQEPIRIGFIGELTGSSADLGEAGRNGAMLAIEQINANGGIKGRPVELLARSTGSTPESAIQADLELLNAKVVAVIGPMTSSMVDVLLPQHESAKVVLISPTASAAKLAGRDDQLLRINWTTRDNAQRYAKYCLERGFRRISAVLNLNNRIFSESWMLEFKLAFEQGGGQVISIQHFESSAESQLPTVEAMLKPHPDALVLVTNAGDSARLAQQTRKLDKDVPLVAAEWAGTDQLIELGGNSVEGLAIMQQFNPDDHSPRFSDFRQRYTKRFGREPGFASVLAHDAASVLIDALSRSSGNQPLKKLLLEQGPVQGLQETIHFDAYGDTRRSVAIALIRNGRYVRQP